MTVLDAVFDPRAVSPFVTRVASGEWGGAPADWRLLAANVLKEKPGRRSAVGFVVDGPGGRHRVFGKAFCNQRGRDVFRKMESIHGVAGAPRIPRPLAYDAGLQLLLTEYVDGPPLVDRIVRGDAEKAAALMGRALAALHHLPGGAAGEWSAADEIVNTQRHIDRMEPSHGSERRRATSLLAALAPLLGGAMVGGPTLIHRDCYPDQFLDAGGTAVVVDLDDMAFGDPAIDAGNLLAHLVLRSLQFPDAAAAYSAARRPFLSAWAGVFPETVRRSLERRCRWNEAASLLRLAAVYAKRERWADRLPGPLIESAAAAAYGE